LALGNSYHHLTFNGSGSWTHTGALDINGNLTLTAGTLNSSGQNITLAGNWLAAGSYTAGGNSVTLDGTAAQAVTSGGQAFNTLAITNAAAVVTFADALSAANLTAITPNTQLTFSGGTINTISNTLNINGQASGSRVLLRSTNSTPYIFNVTGGAQTVYFANIQYSDATGNDITALDSVDSGNNDTAAASPHWIFLNTTTLAGTVYIDRGPATVGAGKSVRLLIDGVSAGTAVTNAAGIYTTTLTTAAGARLLAYIDGNDGALTDATTVTETAGSDLLNFDLHTNAVVVRHDNGGAVTHALMKAALPTVADSEILYDVAVNDLTITTAGVTLEIPTGESYTPESNATTPRLIVDGALNAGSNTLEITGTGTPLSGSGTFTPGASTVKYTGTVAATNIAAIPYHHLWLAPSGATTYSLLGSLSGGNALSGNLIIDVNATLDVTGSNYAIAVAGNWSNSGSLLAQAGTVSLTGANQSLTGSTTFYNLSKVESTNDATDVTLTFDNTAMQTIN
ncbi:MAG: hypothetical protein FD130_1502, partial [Halothiobacillaceae bacterium]